MRPGCVALTGARDVTRARLTECEVTMTLAARRLPDVPPRSEPSRTLSDMVDNPSDAAVVARVLDGDVEAFAVLVDRYQDDFIAYATHMTGNGDEAADIVQESLVRAFRSLRRCGDPTRFKGWLFRIVSNQCKTHVTRGKRRKKDRLDDIPEEIPSSHEADAAARTHELRGHLQTALEQLPADQREALVLKYIQELSLHEMTDLLGASTSALKMRLKRGREALRLELEGTL